MWRWGCPGFPVCNSFPLALVWRDGAILSYHSPRYGYLALVPCLTHRLLMAVLLHHSAPKKEVGGVACRVEEAVRLPRYWQHWGPVWAGPGRGAGPRGWGLRGQPARVRGAARDPPTRQA